MAINFISGHKIIHPHHLTQRPLAKENPTCWAHTAPRGATFSSPWIYGLPFRRGSALWDETRQTEGAAQVSSCPLPGLKSGPSAPDDCFLLSFVSLHGKAQGRPRALGKTKAQDDATGPRPLRFGLFPRVSSFQGAQLKVQLKSHFKAHLITNAKVLPSGSS